MELERETGIPAEDTIQCAATAPGKLVHEHSGSEVVEQVRNPKIVTSQSSLD